jgi:2',3'-cyclic-nucleotide 2'-phosphodiesterase (5'-nucleotidase family)
LNLVSKNQKINATIKSALTCIAALCLFLSCNRQIHYSSYQDQQYAVKDSTTAESNVELTGIIRPYQDSIREIMSEVIVYSEGVLSKNLPEGTLGNYCTDACLIEINRQREKKQQTKADFCLLNNGGLRAPLPEGPITLGQVFELMPFENELVLVQLDSSSIKQVMDYTAVKKGAPVSGIRFALSGEKADSIEAGDEMLGNKRKYLMLTSDYIANGGDGYSMLKTKATENTGIKVRDALIMNMKRINAEGRKIIPYTDGRIRKIQP